MRRFVFDHRLFLGLTLFYWLTRLLFLSGDVNVLEADEADYHIVVQGFAEHTGWPLYKGQPYLEQFPLFHYLASLLMPLTYEWGPLVAERLLAALGGYGIGLALYFFCLRRHKKQTGAMAALLFWMVPLSLFYSRSGTLDLFYLGWVYLSLVTFLYGADTKQRAYGVVAGFLFAVAVLSKTSALVFLSSFVLLWLYKPRHYLRILTPFLLTATTLTVVFYGGFYWTFQRAFVTQSGSMVSLHLLPLFIIKVHLVTVWIYAQKMWWWLSIPFSLVALTGYAVGFTRIRKVSSESWMEIFAFTVPGCLFLWLFNESPRYFLPLIPALSLSAATVISLTPVPFLVTIFLSSLMIPWSVIAFRATLHRPFQTIRPALDALLSQYPTLPVSTTLDPKKVRIFIPGSFTLATPESTRAGIVLTDEQYSPLIAAFSQPEYQAVKQVLALTAEAQAYWQWTDPYPYFPENLRGNTFRLFLYTTH